MSEIYLPLSIVQQLTDFAWNSSYTNAELREKLKLAVEQSGISVDRHTTNITVDDYVVHMLSNYEKTIKEYVESHLTVGIEEYIKDKARLIEVTRFPSGYSSSAGIPATTFTYAIMLGEVPKRMQVSYNDPQKDPLS